MLRTKRLSDPPMIPYCVKYGSRRQARTSIQHLGVVDFQFLRPRPSYPISGTISPEIIREMKTFIKSKA